MRQHAEFFTSPFARYEEASESKELGVLTHHRWPQYGQYHIGSVWYARDHELTRDRIRLTSGSIEIRICLNNRKTFKSSTTRRINSTMETSKGLIAESKPWIILTCSFYAYLFPRSLIRVISNVMRFLRLNLNAIET